MECFGVRKEVKVVIILNVLVIPSYPFGACVMSSLLTFLPWKVKSGWRYTTHSVLAPRRNYPFGIFLVFEILIDSRFPQVKTFTGCSTCKFNTAQLIFDDSKGQSEFRLKKGEKVSEKKYSLTGIGGFYPI